MSYGRFLQTLGPSDEARIQEQYETFIAQREREMAKRREERVSRNAGNDVDVFRNLSLSIHNRGYLFDAVGGGTTLSGVFFHLRGGNMRRTVVYY